MKLIGSLLIIFASIISGHFYEKKLKSHIKNTDELSLLLIFIRDKINYFSMSVNDIFSKYQTQNSFVQEIIEGNPDFSVFDENLSGEINDFFSTIGKGFKKEQLAICDSLINKLSLYSEKLKIDFEKKVKTFRSLSLFLGLGTVILLI